MASAELHEAFLAHLGRWSKRSCKLGMSDCVHFVTEWIDAQRGTLLTEEVALKWRLLPFQEARMVAEPGKLRAAVIEVLGAPTEAPAKLGDVVMLRSLEGQDALGISGDVMVYGLVDDGVGALGISRVEAVWPLERIT